MASLVNDTFVAPASAGKLYAGRSAMSGIGNARVAVWGQSNAVGRALQSDLSSSPLSSDAELADYMNGGLPFSRVLIWKSASFETLTSTNTGCDAGQFGPEFGLAVRWMRETVSGNLYIEKWSSSGSSITANLFVPGVWPYTTAIAWRSSADAWLSERGLSIDKEGWVWIQGESDNAMSQATYQGHLEALMSSLQTDGVRPAGNTDVLVQMASTSAMYGAGVAAAKAAIASANPARTKVVDAPGGAGYMKGDNLHQNGRGQLQMAYNAFELIFGAPHIGV